jgi:hypothetical protein
VRLGVSRDLTALVVPLETVALVVPPAVVVGVRPAAEEVEEQLALPVSAEDALPPALEVMVATAPGA